MSARWTIDLALSYRGASAVSPFDFRLWDIDYLVSFKKQNFAAILNKSVIENEYDISTYDILSKYAFE